MDYTNLLPFYPTQPQPVVTFPESTPTPTWSNFDNMNLQNAPIFNEDEIEGLLYSYPEPIFTDLSNVFGHYELCLPGDEYVHEPITDTEPEPELYVFPKPKPRRRRRKPTLSMYSPLRKKKKPVKTPSKNWKSLVQLDKKAREAGAYDWVEQDYASIVSSVPGFNDSKQELESEPVDMYDEPPMLIPVGPLPEENDENMQPPNLEPSYPLFDMNGNPDLTSSVENDMKPSELLLRNDFELELPISSDMNFSFQFDLPQNVTKVFMSCRFEVAPST